MKRYFYLLFFLLTPFLFWGQYPSYFHYNSDNLLPSNEVYSILQDKQSYIWIGCDAGLFRFNGLKYVGYKSKSQNSLSVTGVTQVKNGRIFCYNFNGQLFYFEHEKLNLVKTWKDKKINSICSDGKGKLWISSDLGVFTLDEKKLIVKKGISFEKYQITGKQAYVSSIKSNAGITYFYNNYHFFKTNGNTVEKFIVPTKTPFSPLFISFTGKYPWIINLSGDEFLELKNKKIEIGNNNVIQPLLKGRKITKICEISKNEVWICTFSGVIKYSINTKKAVLLWPEMSFSDCIKDKNGAYWLTTLNNGVLYVQNIDQEVWNVQSRALVNEQMTHIIGNQEGIVSVNSAGEIFHYQFKEKQSYISKLPNIADVGLLKYDQINGVYYLNQSANLYQYNNSKLKEINASFRPAKDLINTKLGYVVASSQGTYLYENLAIENSNQLIQDSWSRAILEQPQLNRIWVATNDGILVYSTTDHQFKLKTTLLDSTQILSLGSLNGKIYALTFKGEIAVINENFKLIEKRLIDPNIRFYKITVINNQLILNSNKGLFIWSLKTNKISRFSLGNGLISANVRSVYFDGSNLWMATAKGVQKIPFSLLSNQSNSNPIFLNKIEVDGKIVNTNQLKANYYSNLKIYLDGLSYHSLGEFEWEYKIGESDWVETERANDYLNFENLPSGNYELKIRLKDINGNRSKNELSISLDVSAPYYQRWWFYLALISIVAFISNLIYKRRLHFLEQKQQKELDRIQLESNLRWSQQNALKAQMNPHFLFNVLNSVKGFIYENDKTNAIKYLSEFSKLVRDVLEQSSLPYVTLEKEIEFLKIYIDLESMLLDSDFEIEFRIDEKLDLNYIQIPSMILQPYIENAFKHGLRYNKGSKKLIIQFKEINSNKLQIIIDDNGIGLLASKNNKQEMNEGKTSFATSAIEQRINLLNQEKPNSILIQISDKQNDLSLTESGTRVEIEIRSNL